MPSIVVELSFGKFLINFYNLIATKQSGQYTGPLGSSPITVWLKRTSARVYVRSGEYEFVEYLRKPVYPQTIDNIETDYLTAQEE